MCSVHDPFLSRDVIEAAGCIQSTLETLLAESDYISIHAPLTPDTKKLIGDEEIAQMKRSAILINTSRGAVIDENALTLALQEGRICGAGP